MAQRVYRVCRSLYAGLDGEGARAVGGRWNSPGRAVVYTSESIALAVLENLVHMEKEDFPVGYVSVSALIPDDFRIMIDEDFGKMEPDMGPREIGDTWLASCASAVLRVRSVVVPGEFNFLLNPGHPEFGKIVVEAPVTFVFDERLFPAK